MLKNKKKTHINESITECGTDTKKLYGTVDKLLGRVKNNPLPESNNDRELADSFSTFSNEKIAKIRTALSEKPLFEPPISDVPAFSSFNTLTVEEVVKLVSITKPTTCVYDPIPTKLLLKHRDILLPLITKIVNTSLQTACFSSSWKHSVIHPLLKKSGLEHIPCNYCPVNNLSYVSKLVEKAMLTQLDKHIETHQLLPDYISAYRPGYCTEMSLLKMSSDILCAMDKQHITALIAVDLSAAFDTVCRCNGNSQAVYDRLPTRKNH
eukprot:GHVU01211840.1.p1 GENE.GHVU01211840.1~~GHVU01211840.1.p1  ORF type:complete len:266 (-),score=30.61 GHVU01211840.1:63-860(-)